MVCEPSLNAETQAQYQSCFRYSANPHPSQHHRKMDLHMQAVTFPFCTSLTSPSLPSDPSQIRMFHQIIPPLPNPYKHASITFPLSPSTSLPTPFRMLNSPFNLPHIHIPIPTPHPLPPSQLTQSSPSHTPHTADADNDSTETYNAHSSDSGCVCICSR